MIMKPSLCSLLVLFAFISSSATAQFVHDIEGNDLINGGTYYILPRIWALGGGLKLAKTGNETCPLNVVQSPSEIDNGLPWRIASPLRIRFIPTNTSLDFFSVEGKVPSCVPMPSKWIVVEEDGTKSVKVSAYENIPNGRFKIQPYNSWAYKIVFCPIYGVLVEILGFPRTLMERGVWLSLIKTLCLLCLSKLDHLIAK
ncbi:trypsin inhibitor DE5 alpha chain-like [Prosopis cineraria]|uniref:trypsin inhibitor DE5 alpha chain-like n=1 Tax=Prosopis cineraria TaxID=364024 RepID=UPI00240F97A0|nr:trypsin inhibitor DE5 alpha chain-like [Prosopis cineraria]